MARRGYREGMVQANIWLDPALRDRIAAKAARHGRSLQQEMVLAALEWLGEEVEEHGERGDGPGRGRAAVAGERGPRPVSRGRGEGAPRVGAGDVAAAVDLFGPTLVGAEEPMLFSVPDPIDEIA